MDTTARTCMVDRQFGPWVLLPHRLSRVGQSGGPMLELRVRARGATLEAHVAPEGIAAAEDEDGESQTVNSAQVQATLAGISLSVVAEVALGSGPVAIPRRMEVIHGVMNSIEALISTKGRKAAVRYGTRSGHPISWQGMTRLSCCVNQVDLRVRTLQVDDHHDGTPYVPILLSSLACGTPPMLTCPTTDVNAVSRWL